MEVPVTGSERSMPATVAMPSERGGNTSRIAHATALRNAIALSWADGRASMLPCIWLRDNCRCALCRDPRNGQRLFDAADLPPKIEAGEVRVTADGDLAVRWGSDGHHSHYAARWLAAHDPSADLRASGDAQPRLWGAEIAMALPEADWPELEHSPAEELRWLDLFAAFGFALLREVPTEPGMVLRVGNHLGFVRVTNYGDLFDVVSVPDPNNLAYTAVALPVHTDNPYRDPTPGVQLLHCLEADAPGGDTVLVDGFRAAGELRRADPAAFDLLATLPVSFRFADATADLRAATPIIGIDAQGRVATVHVNNRSMDGVEAPAGLVAPWYAAYRQFVALLRAPEAELRIRLAPGDLLVMQNNRALHGRTAFDPSLGRRHLQGAYVDLDGVLSRRRVLARRLGEERP